MRIRSLLPLLLLVAAPALAEEIDRVVLRVNDAIATLDDYAARRDARIEAITHSPGMSDDQRKQLLSEAGKQTMREMFDEMLVLSRANQLHIEATPAEVDRAVDQARQRYGIEDDQQFSEALAQSGLSMDDFRERMKRNILYDEVMSREVREKVKVDDDMIAREYHAHPEHFQVPEQRRVEEAIVRSAGAEPAPAERELAAKIHDGLASGWHLADFVKKLGATDQVIVLDHDWIERGTLDKPLDDAVWNLAAGGVAGPLAGRGGLHVLQVVEIRPQTIKPLDQVRDEIRRQLQSEQYDKASRELLDQLAGNAYIVEHLPPDTAGYRQVDLAANDPVRKLLRGPNAPAAPSPDVAAPAPELPTPPSDAPASTPSAPPPAQS
jgi:peptidyl-prolyl cis-trans isomerase SurA